MLEVPEYNEPNPTLDRTHLTRQARSEQAMLAEELRVRDRSIGQSWHCPNSSSHISPASDLCIGHGDDAADLF